MSYLGDRAVGSTIVTNFTTCVNGVPTALGGGSSSPDAAIVSVYKNNTTESVSGVTITHDYDSRTGMQHIVIDTSSDGTFYATGNDFSIVITTGTVGGQSVVGYVIGEFSLGKANVSNLASQAITAAAGVTFPSSVASPTNITAGTITTVTTLTNLPAITSNWLTASGIAASALNGKGDWNIGKTGYSLSVTPPTAATIASAVWQDTTAGDFTTSLSVGKSIMNGVTLGTGLTVNDITTKTGYSLSVAPPTVAAIATAVWTDTTASDFTTALSVGKSVMNGVTLGTGLTVNDLTTKTGFTVSTVSDKTGYSLAAGQKVDVDTIKTNPVVNAGTITFPTGATLASTTNITAGTIATVTNLTNAPSSGDLTSTMKTSVENAVWDATMSSHVTSLTTGAALNAAGGAGDPWSTALPGSYGAGTAGKIIGDNINATIASRLASASISLSGGSVTVGTNSDKTGYSLTQTFPSNFSALGISVGGHVSNVDTLTTYTGDTPQTGDGYALSNGASGFAAVKGDTAAIKLKTDNLPASPAAVSDVPTANANADALLDRSAGIETNRTLRQGLRVMLAALAGKASGLATTTAIYRDTNDTKDRITATVDADGNRNAVTLDPS